MASKRWMAYPGEFLVLVPKWLARQFEIECAEDAPDEFLADQVQQFYVGAITTKKGKRLAVELEACSGQSNWWATINIWEQHEGLVAQSEPFEDIIGHQEFTFDFEGELITVDFDVEVKA